MNRRQFLASSGVFAVGCSRPAPPPTPITPFAWPESVRVSSTATRTTPRSPVDVLEQFPELKPLLRVAVRLHPRFSEEPAPNRSKLGGQFLWPAAEEWPTCTELHVPMQPILQLTADDAAPRFPFRPKSDLFQLLWSPLLTRSGSPQIVGVWRNSTEVTGDLARTPKVATSPGWIPLPCRFFPERLSELPSPSAMPSSMREKIERATFPVDFVANLAASRGTKVGGWPRNSKVVATCRTCVHPMDYLLTVDSCEWTAPDAARWKPNEDRDEEGFRKAANFDFGRVDGSIQVYICLRCERWPLRGYFTTQGERLIEN